MARHSKWHNIKHKKAAADAKKAKIYTKIWKLIQMAASGWADPNMNPALSSILEKAKYHNVPKDIVERAIKKWSGQMKDEVLEEIMYEWYWPDWIAFLVQSITSNKNRSSWAIRAIFTKYWWNLGQPGSVAWQFSQVWEIIIDGKKFSKLEKWKNIQSIEKLDFNTLEEDIFQINILDYEILEDESVKITCEKDFFHQNLDFLEKNNYNIVSWEIVYQSSNSLEVKNEEKFEKFLAALDEEDDIDDYFHNWQ